MIFFHSDGIRSTAFHAVGWKDFSAVSANGELKQDAPKKCAGKRVNVSVDTGSFFQAGEARPVEARGYGIRTTYEKSEEDEK